MKDPRRMQRKRGGSGAIGIGTLIVFIAMVLVAVIAAAVIIKTASELEQSAEKYGQDASKETGLSIKVQHFEGLDDGSGNEIDALNAYIVLYGGQDALNMLEVVVHIAGEDNEPGGVVGFSEDFLHNNAPNPGGFPTYTVTEISDPLDSYQAGSEYLLDSESTLRLEFTGLGTILNDGLSPLSFVSLKFMISGGGATTTESATTPGSYSTNGVYILK